MKNSLNGTPKEREPADPERGQSVILNYTLDCTKLDFRNDRCLSLTKILCLQKNIESPGDLLLEQLIIFLTI